MALVPRRAAAWLAVAAAAVVAGCSVVQVSGAALEPGPADAWAGAEMALAGAPVAAGLFDVDGMLPGRTEVRCVTVRWTGDARGDVRLYAEGVTGALAPFLDVRVETAPACDAFPPRGVAFAGTLAGMPRSWTAAGAAWTPAPGERRAYRFTVTLRADDRARDREAGAAFVWEGR